MIKHIAYFLVTLVCLTFLDKYVDSINLSSSWVNILILIVVLTAINWFILPIFKLLTFPFNILSFGLVNFLINLGGLYAAIRLTDSITITSNGFEYFINLVLISVTLSVAQMLVGKLTN
jgi:uncharacterized membrane protein YvlD (DUF360 family)